MRTTNQKQDCGYNATSYSRGNCQVWQPLQELRVCFWCVCPPQPQTLGAFTEKIYRLAVIFCAGVKTAYNALKSVFLWVFSCFVFLLYHHAEIVPGEAQKSVLFN